MEHDVKDMLEIAIANNDSLWEATVIDRLQDELERLYSQEAKAEAFDEVLKSYDKEAYSYSEIGEDVMEIVNEFRGRD